MEKTSSKDNLTTESTPAVSSSGSPKYWMSLDQWRQDPEFLKLAENEFRSSPLSEGKEDGWARREFLKVMGASLALTTFGCVRRPAQKIVPYVNRPRDVINGIANYYASSFIDASEGFGIVVTTREGRPIKIEGNPDHPVNKGGMSARAHAFILSLYDPDRLNGARENLLNEKRTNRDTLGVAWQMLDENVSAKLKEGNVGILTAPLMSPSTKALVDEFASAFSARKYEWEPITGESVVEGQKQSYGTAVFPRFRLDKARYILSIDCDFLGTFGTPTESQRLFAMGRKPGPEMNKLVSFESLYSLTGTNADERYQIKPSQQLDVVIALIQQLVVTKGRTGYGSDSNLKEVLKKFALRTTALDAVTISRVAEELWENRGQSIVMAGGLQTETSGAVELQVAVNFLNSLLGNDGKTIDGRNRVNTGHKGSYTDLNRLVQDIESGQVKTLIIQANNPVYAAPENIKLAEALKKVEMLVYVGSRMDETGLLANYIAAEHHSLENWGDAEIQTGVYSIQQPTIRPLYDTRSFQDSLLAWAKASGKTSGRLSSESWYDYLRANWKTGLAGRSGSIKSSGFDDFWIQLLQTGVFDTSGGESGHSPRSFNSSALRNITPVESSEIELALYATVGLRDGSLANVSWLQEFPDPVTKICWDNYLTVSIKDAKAWKLSEGDVVKLQIAGRNLEAPVHIQPGQAAGVVGLAVGYGHSAEGKVANGVGQNAYPLASFVNNRWVASALPAKVEKAGRRYPLANTQGHHSMEGRQIVVEQTVAQYMKDPGENIHRHKIFSMYQEHEYKGLKWGMVIDLNTCNGCSACVIACQSENNIPTVGKKYVLQGREMHWIRMDRYYVGEPEDAAVVYQPMLCQHCDNAPCEAVCPVAATVHGPEGTNDMIYNRCVGTRYCSNNCPYKVRRFNWFDYVKPVQKPLNYAMNPEVTVRDRGVMEKCTFCTHRIHTARIEAKSEGRELKGSDVQVACAQSCPSGCIVFGDLNDENSEVAKLFKKTGNAYGVLEEWGTYPAVKYQTKIRNTAELKVDPGHHGHDPDDHKKTVGKGHHS